jgi:hypothetical protein
MVISIWAMVVFTWSRLLIGPGWWDLVSSSAGGLTALCYLIVYAVKQREIEAQLRRRSEVPFRQRLRHWPTLVSLTGALLALTGGIITLA